ncbi:YlxR family protein [Homoserinimonas sp. OAct 916]|uniref:YlxR family protein n=1 Tax=Homoserinimonas sp. OAct 916 TaxID=2211450 RepID=UPI000DBE48A8|nr:YlxR family protein [Homoserinimonas sp. OAct 916]
MDPVRTCVGCRTRADKPSLVRVVAQDFELVVDETATKPGRGAWVHPNRGCFVRAIDRRAFGRALKRLDAVPGTSMARFLTTLDSHPGASDQTRTG